MSPRIFCDFMENNDYSIFYDWQMPVRICRACETETFIRNTFSFGGLGRTGPPFLVREALGMRNAKNRYRLLDISTHSAAFWYCSLS